MDVASSDPAVDTDVGEDEGGAAVLLSDGQELLPTSSLTTPHSSLLPSTSQVPTPLPLSSPSSQVSLLPGGGQRRSSGRIADLHRRHQEDVAAQPQLHRHRHLPPRRPRRSVVPPQPQKDVTLWDILQALQNMHREQQQNHNEQKQQREQEQEQERKRRELGQEQERERRELARKRRELEQEEQKKNHIELIALVAKLGGKE